MVKTISIDPEILSTAAKSAASSDVMRSKMCAVAISKGGQVLQKACNVRVFGMQNKWTLHAEERVIAKFRGQIYAIVIFRLNGNGTSKPCPKCMAVIRESGIRKIIYYDGLNWIEEKVR